LGAAYKADVDDARESPTIRIDGLLRERGYTTAIYDPLVTEFERPLSRTLAEAATDADALVLVTAHSAFRSIRPAEMVALMRSARLVDTRNFFDAAQWETCGFACYQLGRPLRRVTARAVA
jgi:UDP-N-acetyl-D-mannosaminuronic acid dehydrogenase